MADIKIQPLADRVVIEPLSENERGTTTKSGIFIPDTIEKERPEQGMVVAIGPGKLNDKGERVALSVKPGDQILFTKYGPDEIKIEEKEYYILSESNILAIINN
ncbi:MAG: co-chaperone GroES [bacterium]|nr:co-chaperone GroES [bacterium]